MLSSFIYCILSLTNGFKFYATLVIEYIILNRATFSYLSIFAIFFIGMSSIPLLTALNFFDALKQYINIVLCVSPIIIADSVKNKLSSFQVDSLKLDYIRSTKIAAIGLVVQIILVEYVDKVVGFYAIYGGLRHAYGYLFTDFSFLSLFLASGAMMVCFSKIYYLDNRVKWLADIGFLLCASLLTSARTGFAAFLVVFCLFGILKFAKMLVKGSIRTIPVVGLSLIMFCGSYFLLLKTRGAGAFSDSGRSELNALALEAFFGNPMTGIGFGRESYKTLIGTIPHNIIYQALAQGGLLYTFPLILLLILILWTAYKRKLNTLPSLLCILAGSLLVPDIFNSRFLAAIFFIVVLDINATNKV